MKFCRRCEVTTGELVPVKADGNGCGKSPYESNLDLQAPPTHHAGARSVYVRLIG